MGTKIWPVAEKDLTEMSAWIRFAFHRQSVGGRQPGKYLPQNGTLTLFVFFGPCRLMLTSSKVSREIPAHKFKASRWLVPAMASADVQARLDQVAAREGVKVQLPDMPLLAVEAGCVSLGFHSPVCVKHSCTR